MIRSKTVPVSDAVGMVLAHDITEIRPGDFKGRAFKKGHIINEADISHLKRLGKEHLYILEIKDDELHENAAAYAMSRALIGEGVKIGGDPSEGKINLVAERDGLFKADKDTLYKFNMLGEVICSTMHSNTVVKKDQIIAGTRAIPLVVKRAIVEEAVRIAENSGEILSVREMRKPNAGIVITGNEVYDGKIQDAFAPVINRKIEEFNGRIVGTYFAPDDSTIIESRIKDLINGGADLIITTGGMSVDPDDVTRFAVRNLGAKGFTYGAPVLPGSMFLIAYYETENSKFKIQNSNLKYIPVLGVPACGMYAKITIFDLILPRVLAGERIERKDLAELGHGGLCLKCDHCRYPVCPFGK